MDVDPLAEAEEFGGGSSLGGKKRRPCGFVSSEEQTLQMPKVPEGSEVGART